MFITGKATSLESVDIFQDACIVYTNKKNYTGVNKMKLLWLKSLKSKEIALNKDLYENLLQSRKTALNFGKLRVELNVVLNKSLPADTIGLPEKLSDQYTIPTDLPYEVLYKAEEFYIGPVIAYVSMGKLNKLRKQNYIKNLPDFLDYNAIKGLIIICTKNSIDVSKNTIEGYYFNPQGDSSKSIWKKGKFPLPNAMFNQSFMSQKMITAIQKKIDNNIFNSYYLNLDKWETWQLLNNSEVKIYLPYTEKFSHVRQVMKFLDQFSAVYLKPSKGSKGFGQMKLDKEKTGISLVDYQGRRYYFEDNQSLSNFLKNRLTIPYIIQQAVHFKADNRHIDFRLILQKNASKEWSLTGLVARVARKGFIITNKKGRERSMPGKEALTSYFQLNEKQAEKLEDEMTQLVKKVVNIYEKKGFHLGDVAADLAVDANLKVWLLELQLNYGVNARNTEGLSEFFRKVVSTPFMYAKALAGFVE